MKRTPKEMDCIEFSKTNENKGWGALIGLTIGSVLGVPGAIGAGIIGKLIDEIAF